MALSGSFDTNSSTTYSGGYRPYLHFSWTASQSIASNKSVISWTISVKDAGWSGYKNSDVYFDVWKNGGEWTRQYTSGSRFEMRKNWSTSSSFEVSHDASGNASFGVRLYGAIEYYAYNWSGSGSWTLNKIARATEISTVPSFNLEDSLSCTFTPAVNTFTHALVVSINNTDIVAVNPYTSGQAVSLTNVQILSAYNAMGTPKSADFTFSLTTYNGNSNLGTKTKVGTGTCAGTSDIRVGGVYKRALPWVNDNGTWKKALGFSKDGATWKRGL